MDNRSTELDRFDEVLRLIRTEFPHLTLTTGYDDPNLEAFAEIEVQPGLLFMVSINLQNRDELHLNAGDHFWVEWFPCGDAKVFGEFVAAVRGVLSGEYRIVETFIGRTNVGATLERPERGNWKIVAVRSNPAGCLPLPRRKRLLQNVTTPN